ncbi:MAG TPA: hypothetical protein VLX29_11690 [Nitrospirota bacterium]|nr:hypothetical protein [Nitrospirota bacterium]
MILAKQIDKGAISSNIYECMITVRIKVSALIILSLVTFMLIGLLDERTSFATEPRMYQSVEIYNPAGVRPDHVYVDRLLQKTMKQMGKTKPALAGKFSDGKSEKIIIRKDIFVEINELFYDRGWTDGLPIVPPTADRVKEMLAGSDLSADYVVAALDPMGGQATVEKIAVNAVMAGCNPAYMPILLAAVEAVARPEFDLRGVSTTTNPDIPMLIVSGPIVGELGINADTNTLGRGWKANATIGRALHLILQNVGGSWPGITDMSAIGQPGEFSMMLAENQSANPWEPLHMGFGFPKAANVVTLLSAEGTHNILGIGLKSEIFLKLVANHLAGLDRAYRSTVLLIIATDTAEMLSREGWDRQKIIEFIKEHAVMPFSRYKELFIDSGRARRHEVPSWVFETSDPHTMIPVPFIDHFLILVAGGTGEKSMLIPGWSGGIPVSKEIRIPSYWDDLLKINKP